MAYLVGTDEAGYGPNLGPLLIAASQWQIHQDRTHAAQEPGFLHDFLPAAVTDSPAPGDPRVAVADSKTVYQPSRGLAELERSVLSFASLLPQAPSRWTWRNAWHTLCPAARTWLERLPWYADYDEPLPVAAAPERLVESTQLLEEHLGRSELAFQRLLAVAVFPQQLNDGIASLGNKASVLSSTTLALTRQIVDAIESVRSREESVTVWGDKHGGRTRYGRWLQEHFDEWLVEVLEESTACSRYRWGSGERRVDFRFAPRSECFFPTALASMTAKYLRELAMRALNRFWGEQVQGLRPTAGYPIDARRFRREIQRRRQELAIDECVLWRSR